MPGVSHSRIYILGGRGRIWECRICSEGEGYIPGERVDGLENIESGCSHFFSDLDHFCICLDNF